ncbi:MAG: patatin-like phospholipase family protein [Verrucomicrobiota bacterium]|jgi:predicted acylesterase/phospholipase RssA
MKGTPGLWLVMLALPGWLCGGCRTAEMTMLCVSRLKSPVTVATPGLNKPFTPAELEQAQIDRATLKPSEWPAPGLVNPSAGAPLGRVNQARLDAGAELRQKDRLVIVCLSGGGARAARMAAHTLACLEQKYNRQYPAAAANHPLAGEIDAWSSISGGSLYASFAARQLLRDQGWRTNTFALLASQGRARWGTQGLGGMAALYYLWPGNLGYGPLMQFFTDWDTLDLFVHTLALCHEGGFPFLPSPRMSKLGELPVRPRFFFNATCRETSRPFIFTQSVVHRDLSGDPLARLTQDPLLRWIQGQPTPPNELNEPFRYASTLEDLGSPPNRFPLAYAAMASAAFPGIFEPLRLHRYWLATNAAAGPRGHPKPWRLRTEVTLADGGLYDNTGLTTALEFFDYLSRGPNPAEETGSAGHRREQPTRGLYRRAGALPVSHPLRPAFPGRRRRRRHRQQDVQQSAGPGRRRHQPPPRGARTSRQPGGLPPPSQRRLETHPHRQRCLHAGQAPASAGARRQTTLVANPGPELFRPGAGHPH